METEKYAIELDMTDLDINEFFALIHAEIVEESKTGE